MVGGVNFSVGCINLEVCGVSQCRAVGIVMDVKRRVQQFIYVVLLLDNLVGGGSTLFDIAERIQAIWDP